METAGVILEGKVKGRTRLDPPLAQGDAARGHGERYTEREPALAHLGLAGQNRCALGDDAGYDPFGVWELLGEQLLRRQDIIQD